MKALELVKNKYGLRVNCPKCVRHYNHHNIDKCTHFEKQGYKSILYVDGKVKVKHHKTRELDVALFAAVQFKKEVKNGVLNVLSEQKDFIDPNSISVRDAANNYLNFKNGNNVASHLKRDLSSKHLVSIEKAIGDFINVLENKGFNIDEMPLKSIEDIHVGYWYDYIKATYSEGSWSSPLSKLKPWITHMINREKVMMYNPFLDVKFEQIVNDIEAITEEEFEGVCKAVVTGPHFQYLGGKTTKRRNCFRPYLIDAFKLALNSGLRREEYLTLEWSDIYKIDNSEEYMIITDNKKVERMTKKKYKKKYIPVHEDLKKLLNELGWEQLKGINKYIIEPLRTVTVGTLINDCSRAFTHYYKQAFPGKEYKQLKVLRKTYLSYLNKEVGDDMIHFSSHGDMKVLENHYLDKKVVAKGIDMKIFG